jgi:hypothetical protein
LPSFSLSEELRETQGFFRFGKNAICYGQTASGDQHSSPSSPLYDALGDATVDGSRVSLPFDPVQVVENLRAERYVQRTHDPRKSASSRLLYNAYYLLRPLMPVPVRTPIQKLYFRGWREISFPSWPVDSTVENIHEQLLRLALQSRQGKPVPFIWFWPEGTPSCTILTHDVETQAGLDFCSRLMDLDDSFAIKSSFQLVPERCYRIPDSVVSEIRNRGFELNIHDLNHDGRLFSSKAEFLRRAAKINHYARGLGAEGFRSAAMYRNIEWYDALDISYDMSVPNVSHLEPQRGGCCTVLPFMVGNIVELPLTLVQDYTLFNILNDRSTKVWHDQIKQIRDKNGLISANIHPDYVCSEWARGVYKDLLAHFSELRSEGKTWIALPRQVAHWWKQRNGLRLVPCGESWKIEGEGKERARLAYACLEGDSLRYEVSTSAVEGETPDESRRLLDRCTCAGLT